MADGDGAGGDRQLNWKPVCRARLAAHAWLHTVFLPIPTFLGRLSCPGGWARRASFPPIRLESRFCPMLRELLYLAFIIGFRTINRRH